MSRRSIVSALRSRRLAVWLLAGLTVWAAIGTVAPRVFSAPLFSAGMGLLALSTALCAWERTRHASRVWRAARRPLDVDDRRLKARSAVSVAVSVDRDTDVVAADLHAALRGLGLRVRRSGPVLEGRAGRWGVVGSPLFHWTLALLVLVVGAGRLTRAEGFVGVPVGESRPDVADSYGDPEEGPLFRGYTGLRITVTGIEFDHMDGGVNRGAAPLVALTSDDTTLTEQLVFPNHPLKWGALTIHRDAYGLSPKVTLLSSTGTEVGTVRPLLDLVEGASRTTTATIELTSGDGAAFALHVAAPVAETTPTLTMRFEDASGATLAEAEVPVGEALDLPTGDRVVFADTGYYARLSVVHDWSVRYMYALFALALAGISIAVLNPYRRVVVAIVEEDGMRAIRLSARHARASALFRVRVREAVTRAVGGTAEEEASDARSHGD